MSSLNLHPDCTWDEEPEPFVVNLAEREGHTWLSITRGVGIEVTYYRVTPEQALQLADAIRAAAMAKMPPAERIADLAEALASTHLHADTMSVEQKQAYQDAIKGSIPAHEVLPY